ncbi:hypothetical protein VTK56DRAFT_6321 [Thermocarpiscus australiensis]
MEAAVARLVSSGQPTPASPESIMIGLGLLSALVWVAGLAAASPSAAALVGVRTRNFPGTSDEYTLHAVRRRLAALAHERRDTVLKNSTSIEQSWNDATLFTLNKETNKTTSIGQVDAGLSIQVKCLTCYFKASVTAELSINGTFDLANTLHNLTEQFEDEFHNLTRAGIAFLDAELKNVQDVLQDAEDLIASGDFSITDFVNEVASFDNVTFNTTIDIVPPPLPEVQLLFQIDHLDLYVAIDTITAAEATMTIPLYKSKSPFGVSASDDLEIGIFVTMDLILSVNGELDIRSGFHLLLDKPVGFHIALFGNDVSNIIFNGGKFEFLPVTLIKGEVSLKAILRVGMHAGFDISSDAFTGKGANVGLQVLEEAENALNFSAGMEVGVYAHVAEFLTNITGGANLAAQDGCDLKIIQEYTLGLGATAGATLAIADHTWGPQPATTVPIFYTTLANVCAVTAHGNTTTSAAAARRRQATDGASLTTSTLTTTALFTGVGCASPALQALCPQSLQTTSIQTSTLTLVTAVPSGVTPTFPATKATTVPSTSPFGNLANKLDATTGVPVSYVPPPPPSSSSTASASPSTTSGILNDIGNVVNGETNRVSNKLIIGLSVGLGVPFVMAVVSGLVYCIRRKRYTPAPKTDTAVEYTGGYQSQLPAEREGMLKKGPAVAIGEVAH